MSTKVVFITSGTTFVIPSDFVSLISIEALGGGASGLTGASGTGGGGGAYASTAATSGISANGTTYVSIGAGGVSNGAAGDTWFNAISNTAPTITTQGILAKGGSTTAGGLSTSSVGTITFSGGNGGASLSNSRGGGGGAAGPSGVGKNGGSSIGSSTSGNGGGGANGGSSTAGNAGTSTVGGSGGLNSSGTGAGLGATSSTASTVGVNGGGGGGGAVTTNTAGSDGGAGAIWVQTLNSAFSGPGGGGGGGVGSGAVAGTGGLYGGGAGSRTGAGIGAQGIIVFTYNTSGTGTAYFVTCIANLNRLRTTGSLNTFSLNAVAVDDSLYSNGVSSTSTLATPRLFSKAITYLSTSATTIKKGVLKLLSLVSTTTTSPLLKSLKKTFATVTSVSTTTLSRAIAHALAVLSTSIALIFKAITHPLSTVTSSSSASVFKIAAKSFVTALTSTALVIKAVFVTFITLGNKYVITGGLNGKPLNTLALNTDVPVYTTTTGVTSASTVSTNSVFKKLITYLQTSSSSIVINFTYLLRLLFTSTNTVALVKSVVAIRSSVTNSVASIVKAVRISLIDFSDVTLVVISGIGKHLVGISEIVPSTASINKAVRKILGFASTSSVKLYFGYFRNLIATASVSIVSTIKKVSKALAATTVVSTITLLSGKAFFKILSVTQSAVSTLSIGKVFLRIVSLVVTSTLSLAKGVKAIRAVVQTPIVVLLKPSTRLLLLVTTVVATVVSFLYRLAANSKDIVYVPTKRTALQLAGFISILVRLKKTGVTASKQDNLNG